MKYDSLKLLIILIFIIGVFIVGCSNESTNEQSEEENVEVEGVDEGTNESGTEDEGETVEAEQQSDEEVIFLQSDTLEEHLEELAIKNAELGAEYSVKYKGEYLDFNYLNCNALEVSNFMAAEGDDYNFYVEFHFDEDGLDHDRVGVAIFDGPADERYIYNEDQFDQLKISEDGRIITGEMDLELEEDVERMGKFEHIEFYLNCGDI